MQSAYGIVPVYRPLRNKYLNNLLTCVCIKMKKKLWILLALVLISMTIFYFNIRQNNDNLDNKLTLEKLRSLPYLTHTAEKVDENRSGVTIYNKDLVFDGYNLYHGILIDMDGKLVNSWPGLDNLIMLEDLSFLAYDLDRIGLYYWNSTPIWIHNVGVHHDATITDKGTFLILSREVHRYKNRDVEFDVIIELSPEGEEIYRWSTYDHFDYINKKFHWTSPLDEPAEVYDPECDRGQFGGCYEYYHMNSIQTLPETPIGKTDKRFQKGNWLISLLEINAIVILDKDTKELVWYWGRGELKGQHMPRMLENGNILIYDNDGLAINVTRIIEIDPVKKEIVWQYMANPPQSFFSANMGSFQRLPNGNMLILESNKGRAFEVTKEGEIVWEWFNPTIEDGHRETLYRMIRLPKDKIDRILVKDNL